MQIIVLFGLPGAGKTFVGNILQQYFRYYHHDGDIDLPYNMRNAILKQIEVTNIMRDIFFQKIIKRSKQLQRKYKKIVVTQTFIKEKYRSLFIQEFLETKFILVQTANTIRETRLILRKDYPLDLAYARKMCLNFDTPHIAHSVINNDSDGDKSIKKQLQLLLNKEQFTTDIVNNILRNFSFW